MNRLSLLAVMFLGTFLFSFSNSSNAAWQDVCDGRELAPGISCGCHAQSICLTGARCDIGHRDYFNPALILIPPNFGQFCIYSGYSEEPVNPVVVPSQENRETLWGWSDVHEHQFANLAYGGAMFWGAPFDKRGINAALAFCDYTYDFMTYTPSLAKEVLSLIKYPSGLEWLLKPLTDELKNLRFGQIPKKNIDICRNKITGQNESKLFGKCRKGVLSRKLLKSLLNGVQVN